MNERKLKRRLAKLRTDHNAASILITYCEPFGIHPRFNIDVDIYSMGGMHRIGAAGTLKDALRQAEAQVPGTTMPLHLNDRADKHWCRRGGCSHFRAAHGRDYCRVPGCDCTGFTTDRVSAGVSGVGQ